MSTKKSAKPPAASPQQQANALPAPITLSANERAVNGLIEADCAAYRKAKGENPNQYRSGAARALSLALGQWHRTSTEVDWKVSADGLTAAASPRKTVAAAKRTVKVKAKPMASEKAMAAGI